MTGYVLDASVVLSWVYKTSSLQDTIAKGEILVYAPRFLRIEVINVLSRKYGYTKSETKSFLSYLQKLPIQYIDPSSEMLDILVDFVYAHDLSGYDALYLSLAHAKKCKLISLDKKLLHIQEWVVAPEGIN